MVANDKNNSSENEGSYNYIRDEEMKCQFWYCQGSCYFNTVIAGKELENPLNELEKHLNQSQA